MHLSSPVSRPVTEPLILRGSRFVFARRIEGNANRRWKIRVFGFAQLFPPTRIDLRKVDSSDCTRMEHGQEKRKCCVKLQQRVVHLPERTLSIEVTCVGAVFATRCLARSLWEEMIDSLSLVPSLPSPATLSLFALLFVEARRLVHR